MTLRSDCQKYDIIGKHYSQRRREDPRIAALIRDALGNAQRVCNIGAGTGSYEPDDLNLTAVEPSETMIAQRSSAHQVVRAAAEALPFDDQAFDAAMTILSVHHWQDPRIGLAEMKRISRRQVVFTFDPEKQDSLWLVRDYLPEIVELERQRGMSLDLITDCLETDDVRTVEIPHDCMDGFQAAYWRRPQWYLRADVQATISTLAQLPREILRRAMEQLRRDLDSGQWQKKYADLLEQDSFDFGYRIIVADQTQ